MNEPRNQILSLLKSGQPHETIMEPGETSTLKEMGRTVAGFLKG
jgi:hypothetical protein